MSKAAIHYSFDHEHLLGIDGLHPLDLTHILDLANDYAEATRTGQRTAQLPCVQPFTCAESDLP